MQTQAFAAFGFVVGVEDLGDGLGLHLVADRADVVAGVKEIEVEGVNSFGLPKAKAVDHPIAEAGYRGVVGYAHDGVGCDPAAMEIAGLIAIRLGGAAELDFTGRVGGGDLPRITELEPLVGVLDLPAIAQLLAEDAELIAQAVANGGHAEGRHGVQVAGGQTAKATVAKTGLGLDARKLGEIDVEGLEGFFAAFGEAEVEQAVHEVRAEQELRGKVADDAYIVLAVDMDRANPVFHQQIAHNMRESVVALRGGGKVQLPADGAGEVIEERRTDGVDGVVFGLRVDGDLEGRAGRWAHLAPEVGIIGFTSFRPCNVIGRCSSSDETQL